MIHLVGLPHTDFDADAHSACAFTTKAVKWVRILHMLGEEVTVYWGTGSQDFVVECFPDRAAHYGEVNDRLPDVSYNATDKAWRTFLRAAREGVAERIKPGDIVAIWNGIAQQEIVDQFRSMGHWVIEPAVGYEGMARDTLACFESYAWMHNRYGQANIRHGRAFDAVIPGFVDPDDFEVGEDEGYAMFIGRMIYSKGPQVAGEIAQRAGIPLGVAGAGVVAVNPGDQILICEDGTEVRSELGWAGVIDPAKRRHLLSHASVVIVPTLYIEPFGTVHAEALMSGVPVIASDWGVFPETVENGVDGYRFRTLAQAVEAVPMAKALRGQELRERAIARFSLEAVAPAWEEWLWRIRSLESGNGWYAQTYWQKGTTR